MELKRSPTTVGNKNLFHVRLDSQTAIDHVNSKGRQKAAWLRAVISTAVRVERAGNIDFLQHEANITRETAAEVDDQMAADQAPTVETDQVSSVQEPSLPTPNYNPNLT